MAVPAVITGSQRVSIKAAKGQAISATGKAFSFAW